MATTVIPASDFVDVNISLQTPAAEPVNFQRALLLSDEPGFVRYMMAAATGPFPGGGGVRTVSISGSAALTQLRNDIDRFYSNPSPTPPFTDEERNTTYTYDYIQTYLNQNPSPPVLTVGYVDRTLSSGNPADFYWDVINEIVAETNIYHVFYVGNQAQLLDDGEGIALCQFFDNVSTSYTPPGGTAVTTPARARIVINHLMCGADENFGPITTPAADDDLARKITTDSTTFTRTQLYYPDSPTGVITGDDPTDPDDDTEIDYYSNAFSAAVVGQLCSGSRFNRAPGALPTANISNIQNVRVVGDREQAIGERDSNMMFVEKSSPNIIQVQTSASIMRNLLFYVQTTSPNVRFTYRLGSCPNEDDDGIPPRYLDQTIAIDWLEQELVVEYLSLIVNAGPLPFTQTGVNKIRGVIEKVFERGKRLDILNPSFGPADGEIIIVPNVEDLSPQEKQMRELGPDNPITFVTQLSESLNFLTINGTVQP